MQFFTGHFAKQQSANGLLIGGLDAWIVT